MGQVKCFSMNTIFLALFLIVHNPADAATSNKPFLI